ncbi:MAG: quinol:cytochrome C oxidoreductase [Pirellulales bacterium]|nr:quinol:cytochrome C oxidoreductase [Pirellulales bacterium]
MHKHAVINIFDEQRFLGEAGSRLTRNAGIVGFVGLGLSLFLGFLDKDSLAHFQHSYLVAFCFFFTISLGALFFLCTQHVTRAGWSVAVRRVAELLAGLLPILFVLFLPILVPLLMGNSGLYSWNNPKVVEESHLLKHKQVFLNPQAFALRSVAYFAIWTILARYFLGRSVQQDTDGNPDWTTRMQSVSAPACILFALTTTFAAFDWLMSLLPEWYSTIFGVYFFAGTAIAFFAGVILTSMLIQRTGRLSHAITTEHYHDLGKFMFGFVVFWAYIGFSQLMLIWYANIPEELVFYRMRWQGGWEYISLALLFGHFFIPFLGLVSRHVKRSRFGLAFWATWLLVMHWLDLYWLVMPNLDSNRVPWSLMDATCMLGVGGLFVAAFAWLASDRSLVPVRDPRLRDSLAFKNA